METEAAARLKKYLDIFFHRKWWIIIPTVLAIGASPCVFEALPKMYQASTTILVSNQTFSSQVAETTVTATVSDRVASLAVQILSNTFLQTVVEEMELVPVGATDFQRQNAARRLSKQIHLEHDPQHLSWFRVVAEDKNPDRAAKVANRLAELFIEQDSSWREEQASGATATVDVWLDEKRQQLSLEEARIAEYRKKHLFELPEHLNANLSLLNSAQQRRDNLSREIQGRIDQLTILREQFARQSTLNPLGGVDKNADPALRELVQLQDELRELRVRYTDENPLVRNKLAAIEELKKARPDLFATDGAEPRPLDPGSLQADILRQEKEIESLEAERDRVQAEIENYSDRINKTPIREQELAAITRDYDILKTEYQNLLKKKELASRGEDIEAARQGDHFRIQDRAQPPARPFKPVFIQVLFLCIVVGSGAGIGVAAMLEFLDQTFKSEDDFRAAFPDIPVLVSIPTLDEGGRSNKKKGGRSAAAVFLVAGLISTTAMSAVHGWWM